MFNLGVGEITLIAVVALLILGPKRLPELARGIGKFMREFRRQTDDVRNVVEREFYRMDQELNETVAAASLTAGPEPLPPPDETSAHAALGEGDAPPAEPQPDPAAFTEGHAGPLAEPRPPPEAHAASGATPQPPHAAAVAPAGEVGRLEPAGPFVTPKGDA